MNWLFEQATVPLFVGTLLFALAAAAWVQTRSGRALSAGIAVVSFTIVWLLVQHFVVTEPEQVELAIREIAARLERNDVEGVVSYISASQPALAAEVRVTLGAVDVESVTVKRNLRATVTRQSGFPMAEARFNAVATVKDRRGLWGPQPVPRFLIVRLRKEEDGKWRVRGYEMQDPRAGLGPGRGDP